MSESNFCSPKHNLPNISASGNAVLGWVDSQALNGSLTDVPEGPMVVCVCVCGGGGCCLPVVVFGSKIVHIQYFTTARYHV